MRAGQLVCARHAGDRRRMINRRGRPIGHAILRVRGATGHGASGRTPFSRGFPESARLTPASGRKLTYCAAAHFVPFLITPSTSTRSVRSIRRVPLSRAKIYSGPSRWRGLRFRRGPAGRRGLGDAAFSRQFQVECSLNVRYHPIRTQPVVRRGVLALVTSLGRYHHVLARAGEAGRFGAAVVGVG